MFPQLSAGKKSLAVIGRLSAVAVALCILMVLSTSAHAQVSSTRTTTYDFQCQDESGARISDHVRFDTAFLACLNASNGAFVQGGRYRIGRPVASTPPDPSALVSWTAPTTCTDSTPLTNCPVTGYRIVYGTSPTALTQSVALGDVREHRITLAPGTWYFAVVATSATGDSDPSNIVSKVVT
jgi:hypothetical protein